MNPTVRIVVAEDEESIRKNLVRLLTIEGFEVFSAENGRDALALVKEHLPDIVLSDVMMPIADGHALLAALRGDPLTNAIPLIFLTAKGDRTDVREGMNLGADDYVTKPFQQDELLQTIHARVQRVKTQRDSYQTLHSEAKRLMHFDPLTCLPNRTLFTERLASALVRLERNRARIALFVIGLDGFGRVNDALGRAAGDRLLCEVANRLYGRVSGAPLAGPFDTVARIAGGEFAVLLEGFAGVDYLEPYSVSLLSDIVRPVTHEGKDIFISACTGISLCEDASELDADGLIQQAEIALRRAKESGPGSRVFYSGDIRELVSRRILLHNALHNALAAGQLSLYYQPQINIATGAVTGCEALMRWHHPDLGFISPAEFIPIAEESGIIVTIGTWALEIACAQARQWHDEGIAVRVAVNLSAKQVAQGEILGVVSRAIDAVNLPPALLELEITESIAMHDVEMVIVTLAALKALGVALAMDDFGTGYSSLAYLKRLPLDVLKIDQSFVRNVTTDPGDAAITRAVIAMAHSFGLSVIAEGVETQDHLAFLAALDCEVAQGYFFSRPLPVADATAFFRQQLGR